MSNKQQLQTNNTNLDALITRVNAAKDAAASLPDACDGREIETCTVTFNNTSLSDGDCYVRYLAYVAVENGIEYNRDIYLTDLVSDYTIQNVKCGSLIFFVSEHFTNSFYTEIDGSAVLLKSLEKEMTLQYLGGFINIATFIAPIEANENCIIRYAYRG